VERILISSGKVEALRSRGIFTVPECPSHHCLWHHLQN